MVFTAMGASYGMAKSGIGVMAVGSLRPDKVMQSESSFQVSSRTLIWSYVCLVS